MIAERHIYGEAMYGFPMITTGCERDETKDYKYSIGPVFFSRLRCYIVSGVQ